MEGRARKGKQLMLLRIDNVISEAVQYVFLSACGWGSPRRQDPRVYIVPHVSHTG